VHNKTLFFPNIDLNGDALLAQIMNLVSIREIEVLVACDWNLNFSNGHQILSSALNISNDTYNFKPLTDVTSRLALDLMFFQVEGAQRSFKLD